jgi:acetyltransferase-like isoleucine patch superfamily enzyme
LEFFEFRDLVQEISKMTTMMINTLFKRFFIFKRKKIQKNFKRVLPLNEMLTDRTEKARFLGFGLNTTVYDSSIVYGNVKVGSNTWIGPFTILDGTGNLQIGSNCSISAGVQIYTHDSVKWAVSGGEEHYDYSETSIGNNCYIGPNTIISRGVILGDCCIVGANSFVNRSFPSFSKIVGSPARLVMNEREEV